MTHAMYWKKNLSFTIFFFGGGQFYDSYGFVITKTTNFEIAKSSITLQILFKNCQARVQVQGLSQISRRPGPGA